MSDQYGLEKIQDIEKPFMCGWIGKHRLSGMYTVRKKDFSNM